MDEATFRQCLPEFADPTVWWSATITRYLNLGLKMLCASRWDDLRDEGLLLFVAHYLVLAQRSAESMQSGLGGQVSGLETAKAVDSVSVSMDVSSVTLEGGGHWNQSAYGIQFLQLARMIGAGGVQL